MFDADSFGLVMARIRRGDEVAARQLVEQYASLIRREVRLRLEDQRLRRALDSIDVCQSVLASFFVRAAMGEYDLEDPSQLVRLLVTMTKNKVASAARREYRQKRDRRRTQTDEEGLFLVADSQETPSQVVAGQELLDQARRLLTDDEREIAELRSHGFSWEQVAKKHGGAAQACRVRYARAVARIRKQLGIDDGDDDE